MESSKDNADDSASFTGLKLSINERFDGLKGNGCCFEARVIVVTRNLVGEGFVKQFVKYRGFCVGILG